MKQTWVLMIKMDMVECDLVENFALDRTKMALKMLIARYHVVVVEKGLIYLPSPQCCFYQDNSPQFIYVMETGTVFILTS